jgi:hypothetical protein
MQIARHPCRLVPILRCGVFSEFSFRSYNYSREPCTFCTRAPRASPSETPCHDVQFGRGRPPGARAWHSSKRKHGRGPHRSLPCRTDGLSGDDTAVACLSCTKEARLCPAWCMRIACMRVHESGCRFGCTPMRDGFGEWIRQPGCILGLFVCLLVLLKLEGRKGRSTSRRICNCKSARQTSEVPSLGLPTSHAQSIWPIHRISVNLLFLFPWSSMLRPACLLYIACMRRCG